VCALQKAIVVAAAPEVVVVGCFHIFIIIIRTHAWNMKRSIAPGYMVNAKKLKLTPVLTNHDSKMGGEV
jgi:hypothetical protein